LLPGAEQDTVGDHPWNIARPFVLDMTSAEIELGYKPVTTYERAVVRTVEWLTGGEAAEVDGLFDYEAEDRFLAGLGS